MMRTIYVKTTDTCNLNCSHCFTSGRNGGRTVWDLVATQKWIQEFMELNSKTDQYHLELHGGEPFLVPPFMLWDFVEPFKDMENVSIGATSNLVYKLDQDIVDFIKGPMRSRIATSWDGGIRFENQKQYDLWIKNIKYLKSIGVRIKLFVSVTRDLTESDVEAFLVHMTDIGADEISLERLTPDGNAQENTYIFPNNETQDLWYLKLYKAYKETGRTWPFKIETLDQIQEKVEFNVVKTGTNCRDCEQKLVTINADGTMGGCPNTAPTKNYSNVKESPKLFLSSEGRLNEIVKELNFNPMCLQCDVFSLCGGDCHQLTWQGNRCGGLKHLLRHVRSEKQSKRIPIRIPIKQISE